ncbi:MAG: hypothetical protein ACK4F6_19025 [Hylemonella sp.]
MSIAIFRTAVILACVFLTASAFVDTLWPSLLDAPLRHIETPLPDLANQWWIGVILLLTSTSIIASTIGLLFFKNWARHLAVVSTAASLFTYPFLGSTMLSGVAASLHEAGTLLWGAALATAYVGAFSLRFRS